MQQPTQRTDIFGSTRNASYVGAIYFAFGALWILLSDALIGKVSQDAAWLHAAQTYKGLVYIVLTTTGLIALVRLGYRRQAAALEREQQSELRVQDLFMKHPKPMWAFDEETLRFLRVNDAAVVQYGYSREEFLSMTVADIRPDEDKPTLLRALQVNGSEVHGRRLARHRKKSGELFHARVTQHQLEVDGRRAVMAMADDVTEEVRLGEALERQQQQFQQLHQSLAEVLWTSTPDGSQLLYVSPAYAELYGRDPAELIARPALWLEAVHADDRQRVVLLDQQGEGNGVVCCQYRIVRPDGSVRWVEDRKKLIRDTEGRVVMIGGIAEDITARQERDAAQEQLKGRLERLVAERTHELEQANMELEAFSRTAAHDLKTPLNGIVGLSRLLRTVHGSLLDEKGLRCADQIERSARDMAELINDLLSLSRAGSVALKCATVDLLPLAQAVVDNLRRSEPLREVQVELPAQMQAWCDAGLMRSVLQNLIGNAWKFSALREQACIALHLQVQGGFTCIAVSDNGSGFDTSGVDGRFRPFQRFHSQALFQGTGIGLVTCQRIAHRHGGELSVVSVPGEGTTARFTLPSTAPLADPATPAARVAQVA